MILKIGSKLHFHLDETRYQVPKEVSWALYPYIVRDESEVPHSLPVTESHIGLLKVYCEYLNGRNRNNMQEFQYLLLILTGQIHTTSQELENLLLHIDTGRYPVEVLFYKELHYLATLVTYVEKVSDTGTKITLRNPAPIPITMDLDYYKELARFCNVNAVLDIWKLEQYVVDFGYPSTTFFKDKMWDYFYSTFENRTAYNILLALQLKLRVPLLRDTGGVNLGVLLGKVEQNPHFIYTNLIKGNYSTLESYLGL